MTDATLTLAIIAAVEMLAGSAIGLAVLNRWWKQKDNRSAERIRYDGEFMGRLMERVRSLEVEQKLLGAEHLALMTKNAKLEKENEHLQEDNKRLKMENDKLNTRVEHLEHEIVELKKGVAATQERDSTQ